MEDHVRTTIDTYDRIASDYSLTAVPELRAWHEESMRRFVSLLPDSHVLVPGCGDGRDSRYLSALGLSVLSFDLSNSMLDEARKRDPQGNYRLLDMRALATLDTRFDGIMATGCLYHLTKDEFVQFLNAATERLNPKGVLYLSMKIGSGNETKTTPGQNYPGGSAARSKLAGPRFYQYYTNAELLELLSGNFETVEFREKAAQKEGMYEYWAVRA